MRGREERLILNFRLCESSGVVRDSRFLSFFFSAHLCWWTKEEEENCPPSLWISVGIPNGECCVNALLGPFGLHIAKFLFYF